MRRTILHIAALLVISITAGIVTTSCEKVINVDLNNANPNIVIEGNVTNLPGPYTVKLTKTTSYFDNAPTTVITGAKLVITDNVGTVDTLVESSAGIYTTTHIQGQTGRTYTLKVLAESKEYTATSTMPDTVGIQYLSFENRSSNVNDTTDYRVRCHFQDPFGIKNYYRLQVYLRDTLQNSADNITNFEDNLSDGRPQNISLRGTSFNLGDSCKVELIALDVNVYQYFKVLRSIIDAGGVNSTATPQNPPSNFSNGALGYFSAGAVTSIRDAVHR